MAFSEIIVSVGLFVISMMVALYLIRYSNQQLTKCVTSLEEKHNELVDLNGKLAKQIMQSDKELRTHFHSVKSQHAKKASAL
jgi:hypothetical protein